MLKQNRCLILALFILLALAIVPQSALANSAPPPPFCVVELGNLPQEACYVDLLVPLTENDKAFCAADTLPDGFTKNTPIVSYCENGYMSYTFHYTGSSSQFVIQDSRVTFFEENMVHYNLFRKGVQLKLAVLDSSGNILQISAPFSLDDIGFLNSQTGWVYYDGATQKVEIGQTESGVATFLFITVGGIVVSVACEVIVALCFRIKKIKAVMRVNLVSQVLMRMLFFLLNGTLVFSYVFLIFVLELLVYWAECAVYSRIELDYSGIKIKKFTLVANAVSLIVGLVLTNILL